jgi:PAS domain S-box-containing protein
MPEVNQVILQEKKTGKTTIAQSIYKELPIAVYTCDLHGYVTSYNQAAAELWGRTPEIGKDKWGGAVKIYYPDGSDMQADTCAIARTISTGVSIRGDELIIERPDGEKRLIMPYPVPLFDKDGNLTGVVNTLIDITEKRQGESKEAMLAAIVQSSDDAIISKTLKGIITTWNYAAEKMYGYTEKEVIGKHISIIIPKNRLSEEDVIISKIKSGERIEHFETMRLAKNGREVPVSLTISPIKNANGQVIGASKIARDITKNKLDEDRLVRYAEMLEIQNAVGKDISQSLNIEEILQKVTDATTKLTGAAFGAFFYNRVDEKGESYMLYTLSGVPKEAFAGFPMPRNTDVFHPTFSGESIVRSDDITKDPRYGKNAPYYGKPKGHLPVVSYLAVPVISQSGNVVGGLFYGHPEPGKFTTDHEILVTGVVNHAAITLDNAKLYEEIQRINAKKDEFIGIASHELKTPVTSLKGYLQIFENNLPEEDRNKVFIRKALIQVNKLSTLISDLLDISRIETGKFPLAISEFDLKQLLQESMELMQYSARTHRINFHSDEEKLMVKADKQRIEQVIVNLLSNAIKYSPDANTVNVDLLQKDGKAVVSVQDFGMGINLEQQDRIFSRFYRVDELATHISGMGIGLYISKEIISRHNGNMRLTSERGKGSTFFFELPL